MTKHKKSHPAPKSSASIRAEGSVLRRSAESIGRMIGTLQRQIDDVTKRLGADGEPRHDGRRAAPNGTRKSAASSARASVAMPKHRSGATRSSDGRNARTKESSRSRRK